MAKEFLGVDAVGNLFDIIDENYVSREDLEARDKKITSSINVGSALIAASILKAAEVIATAKGGEGGGEEVDERMIATDSEVDEVFKRYFGDSVDTVEVEPIFDNPVDDEDFATDEEVDDVLDKYFGRKENGK